MPRPQRIEPESRVNAGIRFTVALYVRIRKEATVRRVSVNRLVEWMAEDWLKLHEGGK